MAPKKKRERSGPKPKTKVVVRRLPSTLTAPEAEKLVEPFKEEYDYFYFVPAQSSYGDFAFSRFYLNFKAPESVFNFSQAFSRHVFKDAKGNDTRPVVEYSPSQGVPKKRNRGVSKMGTIEKDADYIKFLEDLARPKGEATEGAEQQQDAVETAPAGAPQTTPLLEFLRAKKQEKAAAAESSAAEKKKKKRESSKEGRGESKSKEKEKEKKQTKSGEKSSTSGDKKPRSSDKERSESRSRRSETGDRGETQRSERRPPAEITPSSSADPPMRILKKSDPTTPKDDRPRDTPSTPVSASDSAKKPSDGRPHARATTRDTSKPSHGSGDRSSRGASSEGKEADDDAKKKDRKDRAPERAIYKPPRSKATLVSRNPAANTTPKKETGGAGSSGGAAPATKPS
eukprot:comp21023_c0_seq1/m.28229 comp21023_c0_seq1/g.28229  ORF comp21023_c0_seq1/g.28229 comp21023_c0_seq1/m.28229 type:complete len:399 (-) comp21023_c0_seq1:675-1871(-)